MRHGPDASLEWTENKWGGAVKRSPLPRIPSNALAPVVPQRDALPQSPSPLPRMPPGWPWRRGKIRGAKSLEWSKSYAIIINVSSEYLSWSETEEPRLIRSLNLFAPPSCRTKGSTSLHLEPRLLQAAFEIESHHLVVVDHQNFAHIKGYVGSLFLAGDFKAQACPCYLA